MVIGHAYVDKSKNDPLRPIYRLLDDVGKTIEWADCLETKVAIEVATLEITANLFEHSDSPGFECTVDADVDGVTVHFIDYTANQFQPRAQLTPQEAEAALSRLDFDQRGRGILLVMCFSQYVIFRENSTIMFFTWKIPATQKFYESRTRVQAI